MYVCTWLKTSNERFMKKMILHKKKKENKTKKRRRRIGFKVIFITSNREGG